MHYRFCHPDEEGLEFLYDDEQQLFITRRRGDRFERLRLRYKNFNLENFFFCLIKGKQIQIESKDKGTAEIDGQTYLISRPYDAKSGLTKLLELSSANSLILNDRGRQCYVWVLTDEEMRVPNNDSQSPEDSVFPENPYPGQHFAARKRQLEEGTELFQEEFSKIQSRIDTAFQKRASVTIQGENQSGSVGGEEFESSKDEFTVQQAEKRRIQEEIKSVDEVHDGKMLDRLKRRAQLMRENRANQ